MFAASKSGSADAKDPQFNYVTMLLHGNGTNGAQNNTFTDSSTNNFTITRNGNTTQGAFSPYGSNWSNYFDGSGDYLTVPDNSAWNMGSGDFTAEAWIYPTSFANEAMIMGQWSGDLGGTGLNWALMFSSGSTGYLRLITSSNGSSVLFDLSTSTFALSLNTWQHIAAVRNGTTFTIYVNGVSRATTTNASSLYDATNSFTIGAESNTQSQYFTGYISNVRVVKGTAVYTSAFTPSTTPLTAITNTSLLTCADNRFIDDSTNNFTITKNGDVSVQRFSPFNATSAYLTSVIGGSGYFDGSGDYLTVPDNSAWVVDTDYTIEFWCYATSFPGQYNNVFNQRASPSVYWGVNWDTSLGWCFFWNNGSGETKISRNQNSPLNTWVHVAIVKSGTTGYMFLNGVQAGATFTLGSITDMASLLYIGTWPTISDYFAGYISNMRFVKGTALYTSTFTPNTAPLTAVTNTVFLTNFTNAGILDNAMMNDLETVGNAQISTSVKKYGSGSISMTSSGDYCKGVQPSNVHDINGGDFTIEFWVNFTSLAADRALISKYGNSAETAGGLGYVLQWVQSSSVLRLVLGVGGGSDALYTWSWSPSTSTWYHVAVTRSGTSGRAFINGTQIGSTSTLSTSDVASPNTILVGKTHTVAQYLLGYMDDVRITKGLARYTANFTAPTAPFPDKG